MNRLLFFCAIVTISFSKLSAQLNMQLFYDFGSDRKCLTTTLEAFKDDKWGNTYLFIDHDFANDENGNKDFPSGTYLEISRALNFWKNTRLAPLSLHVEYNGGVYKGYGINNAWLFGINYFLSSENFKNSLTLQALYKTIAKTDQTLPLQFTLVWEMDDLFGVKGLQFSGFMDFWWEDHVSEDGELKKNTFNTEPQLWYNIGRHFGVDNLNVGTEVKLSNTFGTYNGFNCNPCLGVKWIL